MENEQPVHDSLMDTYRMLKCAFPDEVSEQDYITLLIIVHDYMSFRTAIEVLSALTGKDWARVYNDVSGIRFNDPSYPVTQNNLDRVREKLIPCGFEQWTQNDRISSSMIAAENVAYEDYLTGRFGKHSEWVNGSVMYMPDPTLKELRLRWFLRSLFSSYLDFTGGGESLSDPLVMKLGASLPARQPDNFVILPSRSHLLNRQGAFDGAADLVVEIITPECEYVDQKIKFNEYQESGVREYWVLNPHKQGTLFYGRGEDGLFQSRLPVDGIYTSHVLPRLKIAVSIFWQEKIPSTREAVKMVEEMLKEA